MDKYYFKFIRYLVIFILFNFFPTYSFSESATIIVDDGKNLGQVNPLIWGTNVISDSDIGEGVWDYQNYSPNDSMVKVTKEAGIRFLRFPGGCIAHNYRWKDGIGPVEARSQSESIWGHQHYNKFGIAEFIEFCRQVGAEPIITLSYFVEGPTEAADFVEYCNGLENTFFGALRKEHGYPEPFNVKYWEIGNEVWHGNSIPHNNLSLHAVSPSAYAHRFKKFYNEMKERDLSIKIGAVGFEMGLQGIDSFGMYWNRNLFEIVGNNIDFLSIHTYLPGFHTKPSSNPVAHFEALMAASWQTAHGISEIQSLWHKTLSASGMIKELKVAITEYHAGFISRERFSWGGALYLGDFLMMTLSLKNSVLGTNYMEHSNGFWGMFKGINPISKRPDAVVFMLLSQNIGKQIIPLKVSCPSFDPPDIGFVHNTKTLMSGVNALDDINIVRDFGFENGNLAGPWHFKSIQGASAEIDSTVKHSGNNSIRVDFDGTKDINFFNVFQFVDLIPENAYRLSGYIRTENFKPYNGVSIALMDFYYYRLFNTHTQKVSGTSNWTWVEKIFKVPRAVRKPVLMLRRFEGDGKISGKAWFDNISIQKYEPHLMTKPPILSAFATKTKDGNEIILWVINRSPTKSIDTTVSFLNVKLPLNRYKLQVIVGDGVREKALFSRQMKITEQENSYAQGSMTEKIAPASLNIFTFYRNDY